MIRLMLKVAKWLDSRFPAKVTITLAGYEALVKQGGDLRSELNDMGLSLNKALERLSVVELNSVHKEPVQILISDLARMKADYASFKASMGFRGEAISAEVEALLNGEVI